MANWKPFSCIASVIASGCLLLNVGASPAPVVEAGMEDSTLGPYAQNTQAEVQSSDERLNVLSNKINNIVSMNFSQQIAELQQQIAELRGQLGVQSRDLQQLKQQSRSATNTSSSNAPTVSNAPVVIPSSKKNSASNNAPNNTSQDTERYQEAFNLVNAHQYNKAQQALLAYIGNYPNGKYIADAHYWLGEIYNVDKNYRNAESEFQRVLTNYPKSAKVTDAKLKLAMIHANTDQIDKAKQELQDITKNNPESPVAQLANIRLQQLEQSDSLDD